MGFFSWLRSLFPTNHEHVKFYKCDICSKTKPRRKMHTTGQRSWSYPVCRSCYARKRRVLEG